MNTRTRDAFTANVQRFLITLTLLLGIAFASVGASAQDVTLDTDADGLIDEQEFEIGTDPNNSDSDTDRLSDGFEVLEFGTDPLRADSDEDGLGDGDELEVYKTDPLTADSDGDGVDDATELDAGTDPRDASSFPGEDEPDPTPTAPAVKPVTSLPNTGAGIVTSDDADVAPIAILLAGALLTSILGAFKLNGSRSA